MIAIRRTLVCVLAALAFAVTSAVAQVEITSSAKKITISGRLQPMWDYSSSAEELSSIFLIRRARITMEIEINDFIHGKIQPEFTTGFGLENGLRLKDAYVDLIFAPEFRIRMGQFKRPFDRFELISSTQHLVIERTGLVRGADDCTGVGSICSYSRLTERLGYSDRDVGLGLGGTISGHWVWSTSLTNGTIFEDIVAFVLPGDTIDVFSDGKSLGARLEYRSTHMRVGVNAAAHDFANVVKLEEVDHGFAYGADVDWGSYAAGPHLQVGITAGDNWRNLDASGEPSSFLTTQVIVGYRVTVTDNRFVEAVEPVFRVSFADPDTDVDDDAGLLVTPGFIVSFSGRNRIAVNADIYKPGDDRDTEYSVKIMTYLYF